MTHRTWLILLAWTLCVPPLSIAEVTKVTITTRATVADGRAFGKTGAYEKVVGTIEFALDPNDPHNKAIVDLDRAETGEVRSAAGD